MNFVLDSNIISFIIDNNQSVIAVFDKRVQITDTIIACPVIWFEVHRGLLAKNARNKMRRFETLFEQFEWQDYNRADWELASTLWKDRRMMGRPIEDADLLIAVFAINRNAILVTDNEKDFDGLDAVVENWKHM